MSPQKATPREVFLVVCQRQANYAAAAPLVHMQNQVTPSSEMGLVDVVILGYGGAGASLPSQPKTQARCRYLRKRPGRRQYSRFSGGMMIPTTENASLLKWRKIYDFTIAKKMTNS